MEGIILRKIDESDLWVIPSRSLFIGRWQLPATCSANHPIKESQYFSPSQPLLGAF